MSKLNEFIGKLLSDDETLKKFLVHPIKTAEDEHGLSKAQRSVLRRVVSHLSNNATNGYGITRSLNSYRRSIRLLQSVMHLERGHALATSNQEETAAAGTHAIIIYYNGIPDSPTANNPYAYSMFFKGTGDTIGAVMSNATDSFGNSLASLVLNNEQGYVTGFTVPNNYLFPGNYFVPLPTSLQDQDPFWFYSVNGTALGFNYRYINPYAYFGSEGQLYTQFSLAPFPNSTIYWQVLAPDVAYGFQPCGQDSVETVFTGHNHAAGS